MSTRSTSFTPYLLFLSAYVLISFTTPCLHNAPALSHLRLVASYRLSSLQHEPDSSKSQTGSLISTLAIDNYDHACLQMNKMKLLWVRKSKWCYEFVDSKSPRGCEIVDLAQDISCRWYSFDRQSEVAYEENRRN